WWNEAFEAAGFINAFQVKVLPEGADPMDIRYNMINWIHRSTRGWSYGASVTDPRTGEIIKGHIALGSQRIRQDFLIASGLVAEYEEGEKTDPAIMALALLRIKQLSCHEVGHTLGLNHNYASSVNSRSSVMDYPHPLVKLNGKKIDLSDAYTDGIGEWDKVSISYGYSQFPEGSDELAELNKVLESAFTGGLIFLTDQDSRGTHPLTNAWDNGTNPVDELLRVMKIRQLALDNFSVKKVKPGESLSTLEDILVPVYLFHRYQITASASVIGGLYYNHTVRNGPQALPEFVSKDEQVKALDALLEVIEPENLAIDENILAILPPRAPGLRQSRELFDSYTGIVFDPLSAAENIANLTVGSILDPARIARLIVFRARNNKQPEATEFIDKLLYATWYKKNSRNMDGELQRIVNYVVLDKLIQLAANINNAEQVRAIADLKLWELKAWITESISVEEYNDNSLAMYYYGLKQIDYYINNPENIVIKKVLQIPQGAPIGSY
ncbi:MAG: zinc-dependent metalloprotease, partial [Bacteroidales bacterium]|nr:zinc-dependent metalloprotease [Bacteroidales bacterium]